ncbi:hypothetical protein FRC02_009903 [Tulasnella sp. 418]|nr:hypothetical protein FRC02_009903 [Tulasnella sp. 418]
MAKLASGGESVRELVLQWKTERTRLLGQAGGDRRTSIEVSIKLSMDSQAVKANEDAITLLGILAMLPGGAAVSRLPDMCPSIPGWKAALRVLLGAALVYHNQDRSLIQVLSPIRSYMMLHHPLAETLLGDLRASYYKLAWKGKSRPGDSDFHANAKEIGTEETNMDAILLDALQGQEEDKSKAILASMNYSNYLYWSQPRTNIIVAAIEVARIGQKPGLADCLERLGRFVHLQGQYAAAQAIFKEAQAEYVRIADCLGVARCMESLGQNLLMQSQFDAAQTTLKEAQAEYVTLGNRLGAANCLFLIGQSLWMQAQDDAAQITLKEAQTEFISLGNRLGATHCLYTLGKILHLQTQYDAAQTILKEAQAEYISLGHRLGTAHCLKSLGVVYAEQLDYDASSTALMEAYTIYTTLGDRNGMANCLYAMGRISRIRGSFTDATTRLEEA